MTCRSDIIFHDTNLGTDGDPIITPVVACDRDCGWENPFLDDTGTFHTAHDWWVTSADFRRYEALHAQYSDTHQDMDPNTFYLKVTAKVFEPVEGEDFVPELDPPDFAAFLDQRFTVPPDATYGLDAYNKDAPNQLILSIEVHTP